MKINDLKKAIIKDLQKALREKNKATLFVSGGSTPKELFRMLSKINLPWEKITVSLCDERCVNPQHKDSNAKLVKTFLLKHYASKAKFLPLYEANRKINPLIKKKSMELKSLGRIDVAILGMGNDGHTASLFPHTKNLQIGFETKKSCVHITPLNTPYERISLSRNALLNASNLYLHTKGEDKKEVLQTALKNGDIYKYPILALLNNTTKVYQL